jgi:hypothetical protein
LYIRNNGKGPILDLSPNPVLADSTTMEVMGSEFGPNESRMKGQWYADLVMA